MVHEGEKFLKELYKSPRLTPNNNFDDYMDDMQSRTYMQRMQMDLNQLEKIQDECIEELTNQQKLMGTSERKRVSDLVETVIEDNKKMRCEDLMRNAKSREQHKTAADQDHIHNMYEPMPQPTAKLQEAKMTDLKAGQDAQNRYDNEFKQEKIYEYFGVPRKTQGKCVLKDKAGQSKTAKHTEKKEMRKPMRKHLKKQQLEVPYFAANDHDIDEGNISEVMHTLRYNTGINSGEHKIKRTVAKSHKMPDAFAAHEQELEDRSEDTSTQKIDMDLLIFMGFLFGYILSKLATQAIVLFKYLRRQSRKLRAYIYEDLTPWQIYKTPAHELKAMGLYWHKILLLICLLGFMVFGWILKMLELIFGKVLSQAPKYVLFTLEKNEEYENS